MDTNSNNTRVKSITLKDGVFHDGRQRKICYQSWLPQKANAQLILIHGFAEHMRRYENFAEKLAAKKIAVQLMDLPGHGMSEGERGHIDDFNEFIDSLNHFFKSNPNHRTDLPTFIFGHSLGALISLLFCLRYQPELKGIIVTSPLAGFPLLKSLPLKLLAMLVSFNNSSVLVPKPLGYKQLCRNPNQWKAYRQDPLRLHTISPEMYLSMFRFSTLLQEKASSLEYPLLLFNTHEDTVVSSSSISRLFKTIGSRDKKMVLFTRAKHELIQEQEQQQIFSIIYNWIKEHRQK